MGKALIEDYMVQIKETQNDVLIRKLHDVNMRLYNSNREYRGIVREVANLLSRVLCMKFENYSSIKGISGANLGIPFNIIVVRINNVPKQMINPKIIESFGKRIDVSSNCGSLLLAKKITVSRSEFVKVAYYNLNGDKRTKEFSEEQSGFTIQHEIEHNLGITLLDKDTRSNA